jgi:hypothetical protein
MSAKSSSLIQTLLSGSSQSPIYEPAPTDDLPSSANTSNPPLSSQHDQSNGQDPYFHRGITFTRGFTALDAAASFRRTFTHTLGLHVDEDADERWTQQLLETYSNAQTKGVDGDVPLPAEFARNIEFWKTMIIVGLVASLLGLISLVFLNVADFVSS